MCYHVLHGFKYEAITHSNTPQATKKEDIDGSCLSDKIRR